LAQRYVRVALAAPSPDEYAAWLGLALHCMAEDEEQ